MRWRTARVESIFVRRSSSSHQGGHDVYCLHARALDIVSDSRLSTLDLSALVILQFYRIAAIIVLGQDSRIALRLGAMTSMKSESLKLRFCLFALPCCIRALQGRHEVGFLQDLQKLLLASTSMAFVSLHGVCGTSH